MGKKNDVSNYERAAEWCKRAVKKGHDFLFDTDAFDAEMRRASNELCFPMESLNSFLRNTHVAYVKKRSHVIRNQMDSVILNEYVQGTSILDLAKIYNFPPSLLARAIVEHTTIYENKKVTIALRDPLRTLSSVDMILKEYRDSENFKMILSDDHASEHIEYVPVDPFSGIAIEGSSEVTRLAREVITATNADPLYGPRFDRERNYVGIEYEIILERVLRSMNVPFETEEQLRARGTSRTPDILFSCPVAIKVAKHLLPSPQHCNEEAVADDKDSVWKMICWIDSKALFGDAKTHQTSVLPQAATYINRFGPGLILYWFGHAPPEVLGGYQDVFVMGHIPKVFMMPTGNLARDGKCL